MGKARNMIELYYDNWYKSLAYALPTKEIYYNPSGTEWLKSGYSTSSDIFSGDPIIGTRFEYIGSL